MKLKKNIVFMAIVILITACFGGLVTIYAKNYNDSSADTALNDTELPFPTPDMEVLEPDLRTQELPKAKSKESEVVIYKGPKSELSVYNIELEDILALKEKGYSLQEIYEADAIGNLIFVDPKKLLDKKDKTNKPLKEVKNDILKERKKKENNVTSKTKKKLSLSDDDTEILSEDLVIEMERISKETKKSVKELVKVYKKNVKILTEDK